MMCLELSEEKVAEICDKIRGLKSGERYYELIYGYKASRFTGQKFAYLGDYDSHWTGIGGKVVADDYTIRVKMFNTMDAHKITYNIYAQVILSRHFRTVEKLRKFLMKMAENHKKAILLAGSVR